MRRFTSIVLCVILAISLNVAAERGYFHYQSHGMKYEQTTQDEETFVRRINKEGACQDLPQDMAGICVEDCSGDSDCEGNFKCCSNGCGIQCQKPVAEKQCSIACNKMYDPVCGTDGVTYGNECTLRYLKCTRNQDFIHQKNEGECPHHRRVGPCEQEKNLKLDRASMVGQTTPRCDNKGFYRPMQCSGSIGSCWCVTREGLQVTEAEGVMINSDEDCLEFLMEQK
ncbi:ovoinhibitor-like isoform X4 [Patiria miniata]|uniref:Uncharacterized protein n=1 Tax=Patiria miniata TaxID=46514 RepID=A0A914AA55_PATMI|nr:ovoinhibitor-like isoform X4 [Patiria miniata]